MEHNLKPWIVILTHGHFGEALVKSAELILGEMKDVYCLSLIEEMDPMDYSQKLKGLLENAPDNTIILSDLYGGTPCNVSSMFAANKEYIVLSGLNLPMLIEADMARDQVDEINLADRLMNTGSDGIKNVRLLMKERKKA